MTFSAFWAIVPRKVGKRAAERLYNGITQGGIDVRDALSGTKVQLKATQLQLMAGMRHYAAEVSGTEPQFILHPRTWLHNERWADAEETTEETETRATEQRRAAERQQRERAANLRRQLKWYQDQEKRFGASYAGPIKRAETELAALQGKNVVELRRI